MKRTAQITGGDQKRLLFENQSIYISLEVVRRLPSPGSIRLMITTVTIIELVLEMVLKISIAIRKP